MSAFTFSVASLRCVGREFGTQVDEDVEVRVWDSTAELRYLVPVQTQLGGVGELVGLLADRLGEFGIYCTRAQRSSRPRRSET